MCNLSDSDDEEEETLNIADPNMNYSDMSEILISLIFNCWNGRGVQINTDYSITGWMLCGITHIINDMIDKYDGSHSKQVKILIKTFFMAYWMVNCMLP